jgi:hypothetical protein
MPGGVNQWRFRLAEEEEKRRRKFGWDDLWDMLTTAAQGYSAVAGIGEARKRTALAQEQQDLATQGAGMNVLSEGREGVWNKLAETYQGPPTTAEIGEVPGPLGRQQFTETPPQEWPEVAGQTMVGGGKYVRNYPEDEPFIGPHVAPPEVAGQKATWQDPESGRPYYTREYPGEPDTPATLTPWQRGERIEGGWIPEEQIASYDLDTQMPLVDGQPRPAVAGLVAPPMPVPEEEPSFTESELLRAIGLLKSPVEAMTAPGFYTARQDVSNIMAGDVPWDEDEVPSIVADQLSARPVMTPAEIVADADQAYGEGWGAILWQMVQAQLGQGE